jgi:hypothetical protein
MKKFAVHALLSFGLVGTSLCQYPGQYPPGTYPRGQYPPGQYPPGQYPGGTGTRLPRPTLGRKKGQKKTDPNQQPTFSAEGVTVSNDGKKLVIDTKDGREITASLSQQTKFTRAGSAIEPGKIVPRTTVHLDAAEDGEANLSAVTVDLLKDAPVEETRAETRRGSQDEPDEDTVRPTILDKPVDAPDRPILRRGKPKPKPEADNEESASATSKPAPAARPAPAKPKEGDAVDFTIDTDSERPKIVASSSNDLISRTKEWAETFTNGLPNFVCQQMTTRYMQQSRAEGWQALDVLTAKVIYEDGKENYREITVGGKRTDKSMLELGGSTSTGEFASTLHGLLSPRSQADFKFYRSSTIGTTPVAVYDFKVALPNSDWFIRVGGQALKPAYSGSLWIDKSTAQVRRIEMQADNIPKDFPLDSIEWAVDYDSVRLGTVSFLLPIHAENLGCQRGSTICTKNEVDFRDYHKYSGESTITFK